MKFLVNTPYGIIALIAAGVFLVGLGIASEVFAGGGGSFACTGSIPANASAHDSEEETDLSSNLPWTHADSDTSTKCEFACDTGYGWDGDSCEAAPSLTFTANPSSVENGFTTTLEWTVSGADSCTASGSWSGSKTATDGTHQETTDPIVADMIYTLECTGIGGSVQQSIDVGAVISSQPASITLFIADPGSIAVGNSTDLMWNSSDANSCAINDSEGDSLTGLGGSGTLSVSLTVDTTYTLTCYGAGGNDTAQITVTMTSPASANTACTDGVDNDGDGWVDLEDPGCDDNSDTSEYQHGSSGKIYVTVTAIAPPDFSLVKERDMQIVAGDVSTLSDSIDITVSPDFGFSDPVELSIDSIEPSLEDGITLSFDGDTTLSSDEYAYGASLTAVIVGNPGDTREYEIVIKGDDNDSFVRTTTVLLDVSDIVTIEDDPDSVDYSEF